MADENRLSQRVEIDEIVEVQVLSDPRLNGPAKILDPPRFLRAKNISPEGLCLETNKFFIPNQIFKLDFQLPHNGNTHTYAEVVWSERNTCGLRFIKPGDLLNNLMEKEKKI